MGQFSSKQPAGNASVSNVSVSDVWEYRVIGAGSTAVDGEYFREARTMENAPCFVNAKGTLLFRYRRRNSCSIENKK